MPDTFQLVSDYMDNNGYKYQVHTEHSCIAAGFKLDKAFDTVAVAIHISEKGEHLQIIASQFMEKMKDKPYVGVIFKAMLAMNHELKLIRLEYDPKEGELYASVSIPLEDAELTERQFNRALKTLLIVLNDLVIPRLITVMLTGEDSGFHSKEADVFAALKEIMEKEQLAKLQRMIQRELGWE